MHFIFYSFSTLPVPTSFLVKTACFTFISQRTSSFTVMISPSLPSPGVEGGEGEGGDYKEYIVCKVVSGKCRKWFNLLHVNYT